MPATTPACCASSPADARKAGVEFPVVSFMRRQTVAREMPCFFAICVSDIPERRSWATCSRSTSSLDRPICRPSSFARRMPRSAARWPNTTTHGRGRPVHPPRTHDRHRALHGSKGVTRRSGAASLARHLHAIDPRIPLWRGSLGLGGHETQLSAVGLLTWLLHCTG